MRYRQSLERDLLESSPPTDMSDETRNELLKEERRLAEEIKQGMPPQEVMWRCPTGAVDSHKKWEKSNKERILAWKNFRILNNPDDDSRDLANVEQLRSSIMPSGTSTVMVDAQLPGHFAMTPLAKENWPLGEPKLRTPIQAAEENEALKAKIEELQRKLDHKEVIRNRRREQMARARAAKKMPVAPSPDMTEEQ
jgi:hypothetical protein